MSTYEFTIRIDDEGVTGWYGLAGKEKESLGRDDRPIDQLTLDTVELMDGWLHFWDLVQASEIRRKDAFLQPSTLEVLGKQLWQLILANDVGDALKEKIPKKGESPLRLSIEFKDTADQTLQGLPWEFLYEPDHGWFLSTKTELLLTRYVSPPEREEPAVTPMVAGQEQLRVLLVAALPDVRRFAPQREALGKLRTALKDVPNLEVLEPISVWNKNAITDALADKEKPVHVVHVVGICRGAPGKPQIFLGGDGDGFQDPAPLVWSLTSDDVVRPRLVLLQLCDFEDGDATENFERLAPALIKGKVPAVLALQYAARVDQADQVGLGKQFYQALVDGQHIGAAVQTSRRLLHEERQDRRFGTPVLYLEEDGAVFRPVTAEAQSGKVKAVRSGTTTVRSLAGTLMDVVDTAEGLDETKKREILLWIAELDPRSSPAEIRTMVRDRLNDPHVATRRAYMSMIMAIGELAKERAHAQP
jgi:hypothetical protein